MPQQFLLSGGSILPSRVAGTSGRTRTIPRWPSLTTTTCAGLWSSPAPPVLWASSLSSVPRSPLKGMRQVKGERQVRGVKQTMSTTLPCWRRRDRGTPTCAASSPHLTYSVRDATHNWTPVCCRSMPKGLSPSQAAGRGKSLSWRPRVGWMRLSRLHGVTWSGSAQATTSSNYSRT